MTRSITVSEAVPAVPGVTPGRVRRQERQQAGDAPAQPWPRVAFPDWSGDAEPVENQAGDRVPELGQHARQPGCASAGGAWPASALKSRFTWEVRSARVTWPSGTGSRMPSEVMIKA
jgi:hypothetical protein